MAKNELTTLSEDLIQRLNSGDQLDGLVCAEMIQPGQICEGEPDDVIILHMDIREPLRCLQRLMEYKLGILLKGYEFWLQDAQELEPHKNLVDQCVKEEGLVQINVQVQTETKRINIVDVLKPTEAALAALAAEEAIRAVEAIDDKKIFDDRKNCAGERFRRDSNGKISSSGSSSGKSDKPCLNWVLDTKFKKEQARLRIPEDPNAWTVPQVKHWFQWAVQQFDLVDINLSDWSMTGLQLCSMTHEEFRRKVPDDPGNVFWTHIQLLKECKFVSVVHKYAETMRLTTPTNLKIDQLESKPRTVQGKKELKIMRKPTTVFQHQRIAHNMENTTSNFSNSTVGIGSGNNGQIQLWQFLLEILTDPEHTNIIQWVGNEDCYP